MYWVGMKKIKVGHRDYRMTHRKNEYGGRFWTRGIKSDGVGDIIIGTKEFNDLTHRAGKVFHEVAEAMLCDDYKRFNKPAPSHEEPDYLFVFSHDYLNEFCDKMVASLITTGYFKITEGMEKTMGKKKGKKGCK